jgi:hypothetical protein
MSPFTGLWRTGCLISFGIIWDGVGYFRLLDVPVLFPASDSGHIISEWLR